MATQGREKHNGCQRRIECIQRFERLWALANVLASGEAADGELPISGVRGVTYASAQAESLTSQVSSRVSEYRLSTGGTRAQLSSFQNCRLRPLGHPSGNVF